VLDQVTKSFPEQIDPLAFGTFDIPIIDYGFFQRRSELVQKSGGIVIDRENIPVVVQDQ